MLKKLKIYLHETKPKIGLVHGISSCIGAIILSYLSCMEIAFIIQGDYALKIIPNFILAPILMILYGIWILFSQTNMIVLKKITFLSLSLLVCIILSMKVLS
jgi:hypothetical protein